MRPVRLAALALLALAAGCSRAPPASAPPSPEVVARAARLTPADPRLARLYASACHACHAAPGTGAPLAGDPVQWNPRWAKGMPTLLSHVVDGFKGMPAGGQCFTCTADDYRGLIRFMAGREGAGAN
jgi:cytochrome c5